MFEGLQQIAKDEFGVTIVKTDCSKTSQMLLDELKLEVAAIEKLNKIKAILSEKNGISDSQEFGLHYGQVLDYLEQIEEIIND
jgi:hypothetical protein